MSDEETTTTEAAEAAEATEAPAPVQEGPLRIRIGPVRMFTECTLKLPGCKATGMGVGNAFPVGLHTSNLQKPMAMACSSCLTRMQKQEKWVIH